MTLLARCHSPGSPHVLRCQHIHFAAGGCMENATRPVGTSFHWGTVKQIQKHCHLLCFSTSVKHFKQNTRTKRRTAPPVTSSFLCNRYWFCIRGRPPFSPNAERPGRPYRKEPKWWLFAGTTLRTSSQFVAVKEALCDIHTYYMKWDSFKPKKTWINSEQSRNIFTEQLVIWSKHIKHASMVLLSGGRLKCKSRDEVNYCKNQDK